MAAITLGWSSFFSNNTYSLCFILQDVIICHVMILYIYTCFAGNENAVVLISSIPFLRGNGLVRLRDSVLAYGHRG